MVELLELIKRLTREIPDYSRSECIHMHLGPGYTKMVLMGLEGDMLIYRFINDRAGNNLWNTRGGTFKWVVSEVVKDSDHTDDARQSLMPSTGAVLIYVRKISLRSKWS